ncbi:DUF4192 family protein [Bogoriella caseilytica]|nr:DUF4192 family protein [Bogoriella caseilytica]
MRCTHAADLVAAVPYLLGFHPRDSLIIMVMQRDGPSRIRSGPLARLDLADLHGAPHRSRAEVRQVLARLVDSQTVEVVLLAYHDGPPDDLDVHRPAVQMVDEVTREGAPEISVSLLSVGAQSWACLDCAGCCPPGGYPLEDLVHSAVTAGFVAEGYAPAGSREELAVTPLADADLCARVARAMAQAERSRVRATDPEGWRGGLAGRWDAALAEPGDEAGTGQAEEWGLLLDSLQDVQVRDAVVAAALAGCAVAEISGVGDVGAATDRAESAGPDSRLVRATIALVGHLAACAPPAAAAAPLATAAYLSWWLGEGARADVLAQQSLGRDPEHRLAALVLLALEGGMPPPWVAPRSPRTTPIR